MAVKLIVGIPASGKTSYCNKFLKGECVIHTDDLYYGRYPDCIPEKLRKDFQNVGLNYVLEPLLKELDKEDKTYYIEGFHPLIWIGTTGLLEKWLYRVMYTPPQRAMERARKREKLMEEPFEFTKEELDEYHKTIVQLVLTNPDKVFFNGNGVLK